uniref:CB1 cannabinoid receptor-interacting protein 1 n=1 Tax=Daphnia galeata TaxID=27404 RepID=A0A8J2RQ61_9CRUS|nr:unnamed protein product [Daphnia galeata]
MMSVGVESNKGGIVGGSDVDVGDDGIFLSVAVHMGSFRLTLSLHKEPDNKPVFCKVDGQRFAQPRTVKFLADSKYRVDVNIRPAKIVRGDGIRLNQNDTFPFISTLNKKGEVRCNEKVVKEQQKEPTIPHSH